MKKVQPKGKSKSKSIGGKVSNKQVADLQSAVVKAVLLGQALPGMDSPVRFADLSFILKSPDVLLTKDNLAGAISIPDSPKPIRIVSTATLTKRARAEGDLAVLHFQPPKVGKDEIALTLDGKLIPNDPGKGQLGLSSLHVKFRKVNGKWQVDQEPTLSAA